MLIQAIVLLVIRDVSVSFYVCVLYPLMAF